MQFVWSGENEFSPRWLYLAVASIAGKIVWNWQENRKCDSMEASLKEFSEAGMKRIVWDNAPSPRAKVLREEGKSLPALQVYLFQMNDLPPFSPELNPAERVFEEVRRHVEGKVWKTIEAKVAAVEVYLMALVKDEERVKSLVCWDWIGDAVKRLPECKASHMAST